MIEGIRRWLDDRAARRVAPEMSALRDEVRSLRLQVADQRTRAQDAVASGVPISWGGFEYEANSSLKGASRWDTLTQMGNDAHVRGSLKSNTLPLLQAEWCVEPASDDPRDAEIAEFVSANLLRKGGDLYGREYWCTSAWKAQRLPEILRMLEHGFAMFHKSWRTVGAKRVFDRLQWLEPSSVDPHGWVLDKTDQITAVRRTYKTPESTYKLLEPITADKIALYVWDLAGARFEGTPFTRSMYGAWYRKNMILKAALSWAAKAGSPPPVGFYPPDWDDDDVATFRRLVGMLRGVPSDDAYGVFPMMSDGTQPVVTYAGSGQGEVDRMRGLIDGENAEIAHTGASKSQLLGETQTGSRAAGQTMALAERMQVQAVAETVISWEMHGVGNLPGLIEELVDRNFSGVTEIPRLTVNGVDPTERTKDVPTMIDAISKGALPKLPEIQQKLAALLGFELDIEVFEKAQEQAQAAADAAAQAMQDKQAQADQADPNEPADNPDPEDAADQETETAAASLRAITPLTDAIRARLAPWMQPSQPGAPKGGRRYPTRLEAQVLNLAAIKDTFRVGEGALFASLRRAQRAAIDELVGRARSGKISRRNVDGLRRSKFRGAPAARADLAAVIRTVSRAGIEHVDQELGRQARGAAPRRAGLAAKGNGLPTVAGHRIPEKFAVRLSEEEGVLLDINLQQVWQDTMSEAIGEFLRLTRNGPADDATFQQLQDYLEGLKGSSLTDQAREIADVAYNQGRDAAARTASEARLADVAIRSEILDDNTCDYCQSIDGAECAIGSPEYDTLMPPSGCDGGDRCRGVMLVVDSSALGEG